MPVKARTHKKIFINLAVVVTIALLATLVCSRVAVADSIQTAGDVLYFVLPATAAGLTIGHSDGQGALQLGKSLAVTFGITYALKKSIAAKRPNGEGASFPSRHTSISFSSAEFMRKRYGWKYGVPTYAAAFFVAYSRVESDQHHPQDVVGGAVIGILSSYIFTNRYKAWNVSVEGSTKSFNVKLTRHF